MKYLPITSQFAMLNVGCGNCFHPHWTNIDLVSHSSHVIAYNILEGLPYPDCSFEVVYHSHILEHLDRVAGEQLVSECFRVLTPGGFIRVVVPDLEYASRLYLDSLTVLQDSQNNDSAAEHYEWAVMNLIDQMVRTHSGGAMTDFLSRPDLRDLEYVVNNGGGMMMARLRERLLKPKSRAPKPRISLVRRGLLKRIRRIALRLLAPQTADEILFRETGEVHRWMYDWYSLSALARKVGLADLRRCTAQESQIANWATFHLDLDAEGNIRKPESIFLEAVRP